MANLITRLLDTMNRNKNVGMFSFILQRITGVLLTLYLFIHIFVISSAKRAGAEGFNAMMGAVQTPFFHWMELLLFIGIVIHALNGFRIIIVDVGAEARRHKAWLYAMSVIAIIIIVMGIYRFLPKLFGHHI
ncbi:MAG: succinate dehydrogenase, cytochrome b556 subunit [Acidobacteriota bacterium]